MKKFLLPIVALALFSTCKKNDTKTTSTAPSTEYNPGAGWTLAWQEDFTGNSLNTSIWNYETGNGGWGNNELQNYREENVSVANGNLIITAKNENFGGSSFTSGRITTRNKYTFKYGKIVGRLKLPEGTGMWPAFWMLGSSGSGWPACGEIDIMEMRGGNGSFDKTSLVTCHWADANNQHAYYGTNTVLSTKLSEAFHYYEVEWNATTIIGRLDGVQFFIMNITSPAVSELKDNSFYIILNLAVGGNFFGGTVNTPSQVTATLPQKFVVDWIRVYNQ